MRFALFLHQPIDSHSIKSIYLLKAHYRYTAQRGRLLGARILRREHCLSAVPIINCRTISRSCKVCVRQFQTFIIAETTLCDITTSASVDHKAIKLVSTAWIIALKNHWPPSRLSHYRTNPSEKISGVCTVRLDGPGIPRMAGSAVPSALHRLSG